MPWKTSPVATPGTDQQVLATDVGYKGFAAIENAGTPCEVWLREKDVNGRVLDYISLAANESAREVYVDAGLAAGGVFVDFISGSARVTVRYQ